MRIHAFHLILEEWFLNIISSNCISFVLFVHSGDDEFDDFPDTESPGEITIINRPFWRWQHLTTATRIHFIFDFLFKFLNPTEDLRTIALIFTRKQ